MTKNKCPKCGYDGDMPFHTCGGTSPTQTPRTDVEDAAVRILSQAQVSSASSMMRGSDAKKICLEYIARLELELLQAQREMDEAKELCSNAQGMAKNLVGQRDSHAKDLKGYQDAWYKLEAELIQLRNAVDELVKDNARKVHALNVCWADASALNVEWFKEKGYDIAASVIENIRKFGEQYKDTVALTLANNLPHRKDKSA